MITTDWPDPFTDPQQLIEHIEHHSTGRPPEDTYRQRIEDIMSSTLGRYGSSDAAEDAKHLRETSGGLALETAARHSGFILGFEYCRALILKPTREASAVKKGGRK